MVRHFVLLTFCFSVLLGIGQAAASPVLVDYRTLRAEEASFAKEMYSSFLRGGNVETIVKNWHPDVRKQVGDRNIRTTMQTLKKSVDLTSIGAPACSVWIQEGIGPDDQDISGTFGNCKSEVSGKAVKGFLVTSVQRENGKWWLLSLSGFFMVQGRYVAESVNLGPPGLPSLAPSIEALFDETPPTPGGMWQMPE